MQRSRLIVVAGPNGSGKTTITEKLLRHEWMGGCVYINPDLIAQQEVKGSNLRLTLSQFQQGSRVAPPYSLLHDEQIAAKQKERLTSLTVIKNE